MEFGRNEPEIFVDFIMTFGEIYMLRDLPRGTTFCEMIAKGNKFSDLVSINMEAFMRTVLFIGCSKDWPNYLRSKAYRQWWKSQYKVFRSDVDEVESQNANTKGDCGDDDGVEDEAEADSVGDNKGGDDDDEGRVNKDSEGKGDDNNDDDDKGDEDKNQADNINGGKDDDGDDDNDDDDEASRDEEEDSVAQKTTEDEGKKPEATKRILKTKTGAPHKPVSMPKACCLVLDSNFELTSSPLAVVLSSEMLFIIYWTEWEDEHKTGSRMDCGRNSGI